MVGVLAAGLGDDGSGSEKQFWLDTYRQNYTGDDGRHRLRTASINLRDRDGLEARLGDVVRTVSARALYGRMMRTLAQTGQGWMTFKDRSNAACNQTSDDQTPRVAADGSVQPAPVVHLSNLCTEIIEVTSDAETAVCNLGSVNLTQHLRWSDGTTGARPQDPAARAVGSRSSGGTTL